MTYASRRTPGSRNAVMRPNEMPNGRRRAILALSCFIGVLLALPLWASESPSIDPRRALAELRRLGTRKPFSADSPDVYLEPRSLNRFFTERIYRKLQGNAYFG